MSLCFLQYAAHNSLVVYQRPPLFHAKEKCRRYRCCINSNLINSMLVLKSVLRLYLLNIWLKQTYMFEKNV